jgi:hypothetical protein
MKGGGTRNPILGKYQPLTCKYKWTVGFSQYWISCLDGKSGLSFFLSTSEYLDTMALESLMDNEGISVENERIKCCCHA